MTFPRVFVHFLGATEVIYTQEQWDRTAKLEIWLVMLLWILPLSLMLVFMGYQLVTK